MIIKSLDTYTDEQSFLSKITESFLKVDTYIIQSLRDHFKTFLSLPLPKSVKQKIIDSKLLQKSAKDAVLRAQSGSTALIVLIDKKFITVANVGDCRAGKIHIILSLCHQQ
jgi:hypothetical protein